MGSIRIPAACCGLVGIKPGSGVVPSELGNGSWFGFAENGPLTTTVADSAALLAVMAANPGLAEAPDRSPGPLRIGVSLKAPSPATPVDAEFAGTARATAELLRAAGHEMHVREVTYPLSAGLAGLAVWFAGTEKDTELLVDRSRLEKRTSRQAAAGRAVLRSGLRRDTSRQDWRDAAERYFADVDVLLTPGLAAPPLPADRWGQRGWLRNVRASSSYAPFGAPWNLAGWPAMTVPTGRHSTSGTPLSVQLVAPPGNEGRLLALAAQIEALAPWQRVAPHYA
jgi:amidase